MSLNDKLRRLIGKVDQHAPQTRPADEAEGDLMAARREHRDAVSAAKGAATHLLKTGTLSAESANRARDMVRHR